MDVVALLSKELDKEVERSRRALENVPEGKGEWKPHEKSMIFGYLTNMVATIPTWITMIVKQDELDIAPKDGPQHKPEPMNTSEEYIAALDKSAADARAALRRHDRSAPADAVEAARGRPGRAGTCRATR